MSIASRVKEAATSAIVASIPSEDILVESSIGYVPEYIINVYGKTRRVTKDVTLAKLLRLMARDFPDHELVSIGTPVNFDIAPTHLTRVMMNFKTDDQVEKCLKEISASDTMIRLRVQPAWDWQCPAVKDRSALLHVGWYDTVYFMQFKDVFLGDLHCRYSAKFDYDPRHAEITHFRYTEIGDLDEVKDLNDAEHYAESIKNKVHFTRVFRDGTKEST